MKLGGLQMKEEITKQQNESSEIQTIWNRDFVILFIVNIIAFLGFQMLNPLMTKYALEVGMASSMLGLIAGAYATAALLSRPFAGYLTDRLNKKALMILSLFGLSVCFLGYMLVKDPNLLLLIRFLHGLFFGLNSTVTMTMASNALPASKLSSGLGFFSISGVVSMAIAPSIGIWIVGIWGYSHLFLICTGITFISLTLATGVSKGPNSSLNKGHTLSIHNLFSVEALIPATICVLVSCASGLCSSFMVLFGEARGIKDIGLYFTVYAMTLLVIRPAVGKIADRVVPSHIGIPCCFSIIASMVTLWYAKNIYFILLAGVLFGIGYSMLPLLQSMCIKCVKPDRRGVASSTYYMGLDVGNALGPIIGGALSASIGYGNTFLSYSLPIVVAIIILFFSNRKEVQQTNLINEA